MLAALYPNRKTGYKGEKKLPNFMRTNNPPSPAEVSKSDPI